MAARPIACARWLLPVPGRAEKQGVLALGDEARGGELVDQRAIHLLVEIEIKGVERAIGIAEARRACGGGRGAGLGGAGVRRLTSVATRSSGAICLGLGVAQPGFEDVGHAGEAELPKRTIEFDEIHSGLLLCDR